MAQVEVNPGVSASKSFGRTVDVPSSAVSSAQRAVEEYSTIAEDYAKSKLHPWRTYVEEYSLRTDLVRLLQNQQTQTQQKPRVLELACGAGHYTQRLLDQWGIAQSVMATDISPEMIELAQQTFANHPYASRMSFAVADAMAVKNYWQPEEGPFDVVFAAYLLNYASNRQQLLDMAKTIRQNLHPVHGVFITCNDGPTQPLETFPLTEKYGFRKVLHHRDTAAAAAAAKEELPDFAPLSYELFKDPNNPKGEFISFTNYRIRPATLQEVFKEAGFASFRINPPRAQPGHEEFFRDFTQWAPVLTMEARVTEP